jgi:hypothetical protein
MVEAVMTRFVSLSGAERVCLLDLISRLATERAAAVAEKLKAELPQAA